MKAIVWEEIGFDLIAGYHTPYYIAGFYKDPAMQIDTSPLELKGDTLQCGDCIACLYSQKSSAGFEMLYPAEPVRFSYQGVYCAINGEQYVLWIPEVEGMLSPLPALDDYTHIFYAHALLKSEKALLFTLPAGSGRVIETDEVYRRHGDVPDYIKKAI